MLWQQRTQGDLSDQRSHRENELRCLNGHKGRSSESQFVCNVLVIFPVAVTKYTASNGRGRLCCGSQIKSLAHHDGGSMAAGVQGAGFLVPAVKEDRMNRMWWQL